jgi:hypothetical protein
MVRHNVRLEAKLFLLLLEHLAERVTDRQKHLSATLSLLDRNHLIVKVKLLPCQQSNVDRSLAPLIRHMEDKPNATIPVLAIRCRQEGLHLFLCPHNLAGFLRNLVNVLDGVTLNCFKADGVVE